MSLMHLLVSQDRAMSGLNHVTPVAIRATTGQNRATPTAIRATNPHFRATAVLPQQKTTGHSNCPVVFSLQLMIHLH